MTPEPIRGAIEVEVALLLKRVQHQKSLALDSRLASHGTNMAQWAALRNISLNPGFSSHSLALLAFQTDQSFGALLARLAELGWIERAPGERKSLSQTLTAEGKDVLLTSMATVADALAHELAPLDDDELKLLLSLLKKLAPGEGSSNVVAR